MYTVDTATLKERERTRKKYSNRNNEQLQNNFSTLDLPEVLLNSGKALILLMQKDTEA